eukprot:9328146-Pyramimonas_sp.AAC.1
MGTAARDPSGMSLSVRLLLSGGRGSLTPWPPGILKGQPGRRGGESGEWRILEPPVLRRACVKVSGRQWEYGVYESFHSHGIRPAPRVLHHRCHGTFAATLGSRVSCVTPLGLPGGEMQLP